MASDGCLQSDGRHLDLTSIDITQLNNFSKALDRDFVIGRKKNKSLMDAYRIQFSDVGYYDFLLSIGLTPAKSKTMPALEVPDQYYPHFLRGLFDGDGTVYGYWDSRWVNSLMYYCCYTSASRPFLDWLCIMNTKLAGTSKGSVLINTGAYSLTLKTPKPIGNRAVPGYSGRRSRSRFLGTK